MRDLPREVVCEARKCPLSALCVVCGSTVTGLGWGYTCITYPGIVYVLVPECLQKEAAEKNSTLFPEKYDLIVTVLLRFSVTVFKNYTSNTEYAGGSSSRDGY